MIISGDKVMFLDPSKGYLKFSSRAAIMLPLLTVKKLVISGIQINIVELLTQNQQVIHRSCYCP